MNREIKFRAWIKPCTTEPFVIESGYMATQGMPDLETLSSFMHHYSNEEHLMQYTGLKDKNGKEIYEGDIVNAIEEGIDENFMPSGEIWSQRNAEVYWDGLIAGWALRAESFERGCEPMTHLDSFEVIGNIYETPELLNNVQNDKPSVARGDASSNQS